MFLPKTLVVLGALLALALCPSPVWGGEEVKAEGGQGSQTEQTKPEGNGPALQVDRERYYYGDPSSFTQPGQVEIEKIIRATTAYQEIQRRRLRPDKAEYWILVQQINESVARAFRMAHEKNGYDLIGEIGFITRGGEPVGGDEVPTITALVMRYVD